VTESPRCQCGHRLYDHLGQGRCDEGTKRCRCGSFREDKPDLCRWCGDTRIVAAAKVYRHPSNPFVNWRDSTLLTCPMCKEKKK
jgi:hypothetical protein